VAVLFCENEKKGILAKKRGRADNEIAITT
jgi:hypothetical protein